MYNFSGIVYRLWGVCGVLFLVGMFFILVDKSARKKKMKSTLKTGIFGVIVSSVLGLYYLSRILFPGVEVYTGELVQVYRNSRAAPPLPVTYEYIFSGEDGRKIGTYIDIFSRDKMGLNLEVGTKYTVYYDEACKVIVRLDVVE